MTLMSDNVMMFIVTSIVLALAPGPDNLYVISQSALYGARTGFIITLGLCSGLIIHIAAVVFGLATWLTTYPHDICMAKNHWGWLFALSSMACIEDTSNNSFD